MVRSLADRTFQLRCDAEWPGVAQYEGAEVSITYLSLLFKRLCGLETKWRTLQHVGPFFPPPYEPHGAKLLYGGEAIELTAEQEELASGFACFLEEIAGLREEFARRICDDVFERNFMDSWRTVLDATENGQRVTDLSKCDFGRIQSACKARREAERAAGA